MSRLLRRHDLARVDSRQDRALDRSQVLLRRAKSILSQWHRLHVASVTIGRLEKIAGTGVIDAQVREARNLVEEADTLCADIDREIGAQ